MPNHKQKRLYTDTEKAIIKNYAFELNLTHRKIGRLLRPRKPFKQQQVTSALNTDNYPTLLHKIVMLIKKLWDKKHAIN